MDHRTDCWIQWTNLTVSYMDRIVTRSENEINSLKTFYSLAKNVLSAPCENTIPFIVIEIGDVIVNDQEKANYFDKFFAPASVLDDSSAKLP